MAFAAPDRRALGTQCARGGPSAAWPDSAVYRLWRGLEGIRRPTDTAACRSPAWRFAKRALCGEAAQPPRAQRPEGTGRNRPPSGTACRKPPCCPAALPRPQPPHIWLKTPQGAVEAHLQGDEPRRVPHSLRFRGTGFHGQPHAEAGEGLCMRITYSIGTSAPILCRAKAGETRFAGGKLDSINPTASRSRLPTLRRTKVGEARFAGTAKAEPSRGAGDTAATPAPCRSRRDPLCAGTAKLKPSRGTGDTAANPALCRSRRNPFRGCIKK